MNDQPNSPAENPPAQVPPTQPTATAPSPPPASQIVATADRTEREVKLQDELDAVRRQLATTEDEKKDREIKISELEDELHQLHTPPPPPPQPEKDELLFPTMLDS